MKEMNAHSRAALEIVKKVVHLRGEQIDDGATMMMLETVIATTLLAIAKSNQRVAQGLLDGLQHGVSKRMMMNEGKPYDT